MEAKPTPPDKELLPTLHLKGGRASQCIKEGDVHALPPFRWENGIAMRAGGVVPPPPVIKIAAFQALPYYMLISMSGMEPPLTYLKNSIHGHASNTLHR